MSSADLARAAHDASAVTDEQLGPVKRAIRETPIIDNHAHPLLKLEAISKYSPLSIVSEAHGDALNSSVTTLSHHRAVRQLAIILGCDATWDAVQAAIDRRRNTNYNTWVAQCLSGIETILLDDGLDSTDEAHDVAWHNNFTRSNCRRIVRIETVATEIISTFCTAPKNTMYTTNGTFVAFVKEFDAAIQAALADPHVVGFKSIICYRTGLAIPAIADAAAALVSLTSIIRAHGAPDTPFHRLQHPGLNDLLVHRVAELVRDSSDHTKKPIQFHTGLGDNDITLTKSSPAHLQAFIRTYPTVPVVLLHSGYPYARDAGYLATVYENVYADIGEIFPIVARHGQEAAVREILEMCPWNKIMWSTDGHWFPETYLLATLQSREALEKIICDLVRNGDVSCQAAVQLVQDILFGNANRVYGLGLQLSRPDSLVQVVKVERETPQPMTALVPAMPAQPAQPAQTPAVEAWTAFTSSHAEPDFVRISWLDYTSMPRMRMIPFRRFNRLVLEGRPIDIGITKAALGLLQHDHAIDSVPPTGEFRLHPDFASLRPGPITGHVNMYGNFLETSGADVSLCPRTQLMRAVEMSSEQDIFYLVGFEIEFVLMDRVDPASIAAGVQRYTSLETDGHMWSASRFYGDKKLPQLLRAIVRQLHEAGIDVEQLHAESAPGQFELILPAKPPVEAVDTLLLVRDTISSMATDAGYKFTLHPKPYKDACGTASHMHLSLNTPGGVGVSEFVYESFYANVLEHLPALVAFTYPSPASYERVRDSAWAGGRWVAWGTQNRETPLRKIDGSHWELRCFDGLANPYLALAALLCVGVYGVADERMLTLADCSADPATLTPAARRSFGITKKLPGSLAEALAELAGAHTIADLMGLEVVMRYIKVKEAELALYSPMDSEELAQWIMERY